LFALRGRLEIRDPHRTLQQQEKRQAKK